VCASRLCNPLQEATKTETCLLCNEMWLGNEDVQHGAELSVDPNDVTFYCVRYHSNSLSSDDLGYIMNVVDVWSTH
jgi:hypothetical protein